MQSIGRRFVRWVNDRREEHGGIFAGRYRAAAIDPESGSLRALAYVETMPMRTVQGATVDQYFWSSCRAHVGLASDSQLRTLPAYWALGNTPFERQAAYRRLLDSGVSADDAKRFAQALAGGMGSGVTRLCAADRGAVPATPNTLSPRPAAPRRISAWSVTRSVWRNKPERGRHGGFS